MAKSSTDRIERAIELKAPVARVWRALTDHLEFGKWFRVNLESPFVPGKATRGRITSPGYEHMVMEVLVEKMEPERLFSYRWHPHAVDPKVDYSSETPTLVEFTLKKTQTGTLLTVTESGFDALPPGRRDEAFRMNSGGWEEEMRNIEAHVNERLESHRGATDRGVSRSAAGRSHRHVPIFAALGDETRLAIVTKLCGGEPISISALTRGTRITRQGITKHLRVLQEAGVVRGVRRGRENLFELDRASLDEARRALDRIGRLWDEALGRLKLLVESEAE